MEGSAAMLGSLAHQPPNFSIPGLGASPKPFHLITNAAALRLGRFPRHSFVSHRHHLGSTLQSPKITHLDHVLKLNGVSSDLLKWFKFPQWPHAGEESQTKLGDQRKVADLRTPTRRPGPVSRRRLTDILLAINVLVYVAQVASKGKLLMMGAKINGLIDKGKLWRLVTCAFIHADVGHLMMNCYSLNSIGPTMDHLSGPTRYLTIYMASAISSSIMSYRFNKAPAVGASGAIFGLVGSLAVFLLRHNNKVEGGVGDLKLVAYVIAFDLAIGMLSRRIDNWGHVGGLIGGIAISWLVGPAWRFQPESYLGRWVLVDRAPIFCLPGIKKPS